MAFSEIQLIPGASKHRPVLSTFVGQSDSFVVSVTDVDGKAIDLTPFLPPYGTDNGVFTPEACKNRAINITTGVLLTIKDFNGQRVPTYQVPLEIQTPATDGKVLIEFGTCTFDCPGMYLADISLVLDGVMTDTFQLYVEVQVSLNWDSARTPVTVAEVRLWARDNSPEDNFLLDEVEYKDAEIFAAIRRAVDIWNETTPLLSSYTYTTTTFPFRSKWIDLTLSLLMDMASHGYLRNHLTYQAEGLSIDDKKHKYVYYAREAKERRADYLRWVKTTKAQLNMNGAFSRLGLRKLP